MFSMCSLILTGLSLAQTPQAVRPFPDVPKNHWAYAAVTELHERGILQGYPVYYDRFTPYGALKSLVKAIHNDDEAVIKELISSEWGEAWLELLKARYPDARDRGEQMRATSEGWLNASPYSHHDWNSFNVEAQKTPPGEKIVFGVHHVMFSFVRESAGWKIVWVYRDL